MKVFVLKITDDEKEVSVHLFSNWNSLVKRVIDEECAEGEFAEEIKISLNETNCWVNDETFYEYEVTIKGCED